jgi:hypothetical protein
MARMAEGGARYVAYSSDVGEAFRPIVPGWYVARLGFPLTWCPDRRCQFRIRWRPLGAFPLGKGLCTATTKLRIVTLGFGTARQKMVLERGTNPKHPRRTCSSRYGVPSWRGKSAGVAKRPRVRSPEEIPNVYDSQLSPSPYSPVAQISNAR